MNYYRLLRSSNDTPEFSLKDKIFLCKVVDIYDGDSCKVVFNYKNDYFKWTIRMQGYDSPEIRVSKNAQNRDYLKELGKNAKTYLFDLCKKQKLLYIKCGEFDKYGRLLGELYYSKENAKTSKNSINEQMIISKHGIPYGSRNKH
jgi:endonuclease YncB( thermonuclease family)